MESRKPHVPLQIPLALVFSYFLMLMLLIELFVLSELYIGPRSISKDLIIEKEDIQNVDINLEERKVKGYIMHVEKEEDFMTELGEVC